MTVDEDRLAQWLQRETPEPPHGVDVADVQARVGSARRTRTWVPLLAAACVVALIALLVPTLRGGRATPSEQPTRPEQTTRPDQTARPSDIRLGVTPWHATGLSDVSLVPTTLFGHDGYLYAFGEGQPGTLERLDPDTGAVVARAGEQVRFGNDPVLAGGLIWVTTPADAHHPITVYGFDARTLTVEVTRTVAFPAAADLAVLAASSDGTRLYLGVGHRIRILGVNGSRLRVRRSIDTAGVVQIMSVSPDGSTLYVSTDSGAGAGAGDSTVTGMDPATGSVTSRVNDIGGVYGLVATDHGFFATEASGNGAETVFVPAGDPSHAVGITTGGGGGFPAVTVSGGVAWAGGNGQLACADPTDGRVHARTRIGNGHSSAQIGDISVVAGRLYARYQGMEAKPASALIELHPPAACGLS